MIGSLRNIFLSNDREVKKEGWLNETELMAAALLLEVAVVDGSFEEEEHSTIATLLGKRFNLDHEPICRLIGEAKAKVDDSVDLYRFTRKVNSFLNHQERVELIEMLWEVVYADGRVQNFETNIMRRLTGLLHVSDRESGNARKRVQERKSN